MSRRASPSLLALGLLAAVPALAEDGPAPEAPLPPRRPALVSISRPAPPDGPRPLLGLPAPVADPRVPLARVPERADRPAPAHEDLERPGRPGSLSRGPTQLPGPLQKQRVVAPRAGTPDVEIGVSDKTSVGLFGEVNRMDRTDIRNGTAQPTRELGAGVTLQYRFGQ